MLRHVVVWSMAEEHGGELDALLAELRALPAAIEEIEALSAGRLLNESELEAALCVDVADAAALARYRDHPAHQPVLERLRGLAGRIVVADYEL
ncbi:MAG: Dabb family protein [Solirubrobacterales bacterium]